MKTKTGFLRDIQGNVIDECVVCGRQFNNPGFDPDQVFLCAKECSEEFKKPDRAEVIKILYKEQFNKRKEN
jgi:hypothetical protein